MTQAKVRFASFAEYVRWSDQHPLEGFYELIDGELVELPPESGINFSIARELFWLFAIAHLVPRQLICPHACEVQVTPLRSRDPKNRYPDLVILDDVHLALTQQRLTITLDMPPPRLVVEVVSPGQPNHDDYINKRDQYAARGIPEYWLIDPNRAAVLIGTLADGVYQFETFQGQQLLKSPTFPALTLTAEQVLMAGQ
jgi:Uma2 family endonuclease